MNVRSILVRLLPREFRERHGKPMRVAFEEARDAARRRGRRATLSLWMRETGDLLGTVVRLRLGGSRPVAAWSDDALFAMRALIRRPAFTAFAVLTLALGVGATTAIYSALDAVILRPLPFPGGDRVVELWTRIGSTGFVAPAPEQITAWQERTPDLVDALEAYQLDYVTLTGAGDAVFVAAASVRPSLFERVASRPLLGRAFTEEEGRGTGARVLLLGRALWRDAFGSDRAVIGRTISLDGEPWTVIGVMDERALLPSAMATPVGVWRPLSSDAQPENAVAWLRVDTSPEMLTERMAAVDRTLRERGVADLRPGVARHVATHLAGSFADTLWVLMAAVLLLLAIAGVNVANLMLARDATRRREAAVRAALGATPRRLRRQVLCESMLLALVGGALGVVVARGSLSLIRFLRPADLTQLEALRLNGPVLLFALGIASLVGLVMGVLPALATVKHGSPRARQGAAREASPGSRARWLLVGGQVALSFALVTGCLAVVDALLRMQRRDPGFEARGLMVADLRLPPWNYEQESERRDLFFGVLDRLGSVPAVEGVALASGAPPGVGIWFGSVEVEGSAPTEDTHVFHGPAVSADYFAVLRQPLVEGRAFTEQEVDEGADLFVLGETAARQFFPDRSPIGRRMRIGEGGDWYTVVGVARDVAMRGLGDNAGGALQIYYPLAVRWSFGIRHAIFLRSADDAGELIPRLRALVLAEEPDALLELSPADRLLRETLARERFATALLSAFASLALLLSAVGLYGVLSQVVGQRTRELAVRISLGARPGEIRRLILGGGVRASALGVIAGCTIAMVGTRLLSTRLVGLADTDLAAYALAATVLLATTIAACWVPARRAARVDPLKALKVE